MALVKLYAARLDLLAPAVKMFGESTTARIMKAPFRSVDAERKKDILAKAMEVVNIASLIDGQPLNNMRVDVLRLADYSLASEEQRYLDVLHWLSLVLFPRHQQAQREIRVLGTGQWLSQHPITVSWTSSSTSSMLLVHGIRGCGKSVLCYAVIDRYLEDIGVGVR